MNATQLSLFPEIIPDKKPRPVNVASVPQRSLFRYPGGKTWFVPTFRQWMRHQRVKPAVLIEPFAGGGIISLTALFDRLVERVVMAELDADVAAVWQAIVDGQSHWLAEKILHFALTKESVIDAITKRPGSVREKAFQTILKNRTLHGGILAAGAGFIKSGENGRGIGSRWYPMTLARRLGDLAIIAPQIDFRHDDALNVIRAFSTEESAIFFIDPPYTAGGKKAGRRLYKHCDLDHNELFTLCAALKGDFLMTYDNASEVRDYARSHNFATRLIPMHNTHHATMRELVIGKDLAWMD
ncbi:MAG: DNA adenine methylase [Desulfobulbaceae bacterium]|jgi:DNA adenine methylase|nr:DNA adenine methylase [Desulfobulbaceae bacterium]